MKYLTILFISCSAFANYTEGLWVPRHETVPAKILKLDFQNLISLDKEQNPTVTDHQASMGLTYGVLETPDVAWEFGFDWVEPATSQTINAIFLNTKISTNWYKEKGWGVSLGSYMVGISGGETDYNLIYLIVQNGWESNWSTTVGAFVGSNQLLINSSGEEDNKGILLGVWRQMSRNFSAGLEFQSSQSRFGYSFIGAKWEVKNETHVTLGYGVSSNDDWKDWILARISLLL